MMARTRAWLRARRATLGLGAIALVALLSLIGGTVASSRPAAALQLGNGLAGIAKVEIRAPGGGWQRCPYSFLRGGHRCAGVLFHDSITRLLNDAPPSTWFSVPAIEISSQRGNVEFRIELSARLAGEYWFASNRGAVDMTVSGGNAGDMSAGSAAGMGDVGTSGSASVGKTSENRQALKIDARQRAHSFEPSDTPRTIAITGIAPGKGLAIGFVHRDRLVRDRGYRDVPAEAPSLRSVAR